MDCKKNNIALEKGITEYQILRKTKLEGSKKKRVFAYMKCRRAYNDKMNGR